MAVCMYLRSISAVTILMSIKKVVEAWRLLFGGIMMIIKLVVVALWVCGNISLWRSIWRVEGVLQVKFGRVV